MSQTRQLAAVMFTDIVGYTSLMGEDEQKAYRLLSLNRQIQKPIIEDYGGILIKEMGDGNMVSFPTVSDALHAAMRIQKKCSETKEIQLRIGIHYGEIIFENNDIFGDAVNIASRIQTLGVPGSVLFSKKINDEISNKTDFKTLSLGNFEFKNVRNSIEVFVLSNEGFPIPKRSQLAGKLRRKKALFPVYILGAVILAVLAFYGINKIFISPVDTVRTKSIAVLPFVNMSGDPQQEYFSDGLSEELINKFTKLPELKVIGRTSSFAFKGKNEDLRTIGEKLKVDYLLEGSVRSSKNKMRITTQLIKADDGSHLWSDTYEMNLDDIFEVQDQISASVTEALRVTFMHDDNLKLSKIKPEAYNIFLQGRYLYEKNDNPLNSDKAMNLFKEAIQMDSTFSLAWTYLAMCHLRNTNNTMQEEFKNAKLAAYKAFELDSTSGIAAVNVAEIMDNEFDFYGAKEKIDLALKLDPEDTYVLRNAGRFYTVIGKADESINFCRRSVEKDPVQNTALGYLALAYFYAGQYEELKKVNKNLEELNYTTYAYQYFISLIQNNDITAARKLAEANKDENEREFELAIVDAKSGKRNETNKYIETLKKKYSESTVLSLNIAILYTYLNETERAMDWIETAYKDHIRSIEYFKVDPVFLVMKDNPRYKNLIRQMNFPG